MTKIATPTTEQMKARVKDYLGSPDSLSAGQRRRVRKAFEEGDYELSVRESGKILDQMCLEPETQKLFNSFTPHRSCQISLIRDVLQEIWQRGKLDTRPIAQIGRVA